MVSLSMSPALYCIALASRPRPAMVVRRRSVTEDLEAMLRSWTTSATVLTGVLFDPEQSSNQYKCWIPTDHLQVGRTVRDDPYGKPPLLDPSRIILTCFYLSATPNTLRL